MRRSQRIQRQPEKRALKKKKETLLVLGEGNALREKRQGRWTTTKKTHTYKKKRSKLKYYRNDMS